MKLHKIISGCARALGLTAFTTGTTLAAGTVIGSTLYTPLSLKAVITYNDPKTGKLRLVGVNTKNFLKTYGYAGDRLAINIGTGGAGDVYIIRGKTVVTDLTVGGYAIVTTDQLVSHTSGNIKREKFTSSGILTLSGYSNPQFTNVNPGVVQNNAVSHLLAPGFDKVGSENASTFWLEVSGVYSYEETYTAPDKHSEIKRGTNLKSDDLSGEGYDSYLSELHLPVAASLSGKIGGKVRPNA